jgi:hypothetical protein
VSQGRDFHRRVVLVRCRHAAPWVRRVAISLQLLGLQFEHRSVSLFRSFGLLRRQTVGLAGAAATGHARAQLRRRRQLHRVWHVDTGLGPPALNVRSLWSLA